MSKNCVIVARNSSALVIHLFGSQVVRAASHRERAVSVAVLSHAREVVRVERRLKSEIDDRQILGVLLHMNVASIDDSPIRREPAPRRRCDPGVSIGIARHGAGIGVADAAQLALGGAETVADIDEHLGCWLPGQLAEEFLGGLRPVGDIPKSVGTARVLPAKPLTGSIPEQADRGSRDRQG